MIRFVISLLILVFAFTGAVKAQSAATLDRLYARQQEAIEFKRELKELGADTMINEEGIKSLAINVKDTPKEARAVLSGSCNFCPWIDADEVSKGKIGRIRYPAAIAGVSSDHAIFEVLQVIDENSLIGRCFGSSFWISGIETGNLTDDSKLILKNIVEVVGNKTYPTAVGGTLTVMHLSVTKKAKEIDKLRLELTAKPPEESDNFYRRWVAKDKSSVVGKLELTDKKNNFKIVPKTGEPVDVKLTKFSKESKKVAKAVVKELEKEAAEKKQ